MLVKQNNSNCAAMISLHFKDEIKNEIETQRISSSQTKSKIVMSPLHFKKLKLDKNWTLVSITTSTIYNNERINHTEAWKVLQKGPITKMCAYFSSGIDSCIYNY